MDELNTQVAVGAVSLISLFGVNLARAAMRRGGFASASDPRTPQQDADKLDSTRPSTGAPDSLFSAEDKENDIPGSSADTPGSITSPKNINRSPLQGRVLHNVLEKAVVHPHEGKIFSVEPNSPPPRRETRSSRAKAQQPFQQPAPANQQASPRVSNLPKPARPSESEPSWKTRSPLGDLAFTAAAVVNEERATAGRDRGKDSLKAGKACAAQDSAQGRPVLSSGSRCILLDRKLSAISPTHHLRLLKATPTVTARTLKNVISGRLLTPVSDSKDELLSQYVAAIHGVSPAPDVAMDDELLLPPPAASRALASGKRSALSEDTPVKKQAKRPKADTASKPEQIGKMALQEGEVIDLDRQQFKVGKLAAHGAMASLFYGVCLEGRDKGRQVMLKVQPRARKTIYQITTEHHILTKLRQAQNPKLLTQEAIAYGCHKEECYILVTGLLGPDLNKLGDAEGRHSARNVLVLAHQALSLFEQLHSANLLHRDIKPDNLVLGCKGTATERKLHIIDFGTSESLVDRNGAKRTQPQAAEGSLPYMAVTVHEKQPLGKRDDVESVVWTLLRLCLGKLPWEHGKVSAAGVMQRKQRVKKEGLKAEEACTGLEGFMATCVNKMLAHVQGLKKPESEPDYGALRAYVEAAWKAGGFAPKAISKADLDY